MIPQCRWRRSAVQFGGDGSDPILDPGHPDLVAMYTFDDTSGVDEADNYPATFNGSWTQVAGRIGNAQVADDLNAYVSVPTLGTWFSGKTEFTISFHDVMPAASAGNGLLFCVSHTSHTSPYYRVYIRLTSTSIVLLINGINAENVVQYQWDPDPPSGRHHYLFRYDNGTGEIWFDGVMVASNDQVGASIGACHSTGMMGRIPAANSTANAAAINRDQFRLFSRALTTSEISALATE